MSALDGPSGHTRNSLPYNRFGNGQNTVVVFQGLVFDNKPLSGLDARFTLNMYSFLESEYIVEKTKKASKKAEAKKDKAQRNQRRN